MWDAWTSIPSRAFVSRQNPRQRSASITWLSGSSKCSATYASSSLMSRTVLRSADLVNEKRSSRYSDRSRTVHAGLVHALALVPLQERLALVWRTAQRCAGTRP